MATVYRARDRRLHRDVAVKVIHRHLRENAEVAARFVSEARAVAKLKHPNIVEVYDVSDEGDPERYLVVELVRGTTLRKLLQDGLGQAKQGDDQRVGAKGWMPVEIAAAIALQVASGLEHAHQQGVVHRDVKPENVLVEAQAACDPTEDARGSEPPAGSIKITDFGIAKLLDVQGVTSTGQVLGSPAHMAPEQIEGGDVTARADVFGLGVLLYECAVGRLPFDGKNPAQVLRRVLDGTYTPPVRARATVGAEFGAIIEKALAHDPAERFASAAEFASALRRELSELGFDSPEREVSDYLRNPDKYLEAYEPRIVERLVLRGRAARAKRAVPEAAAAFNRALAFRPDDVELLALVANLARRERLRRTLLRSSGFAATALAGAVFIAWWKRPSPPGPEPGASSAAAPLLSAARISPSAGARAIASAPPPETSASALSGSASSEAVEPEPELEPIPTVLRRLPRKKPEPTEVKTRRVRILVSGPQNAKVMIDGVARSNWFFEKYDLPVGPHRFEFIPPDAVCCEGKSVQEVNVVADEAGEGPMVIRGVIRFKDARVQFASPSGAVATCGSLGKVTAPGTLLVRMERARLTGRCTILPPPGSPDAPKEIDVTLQPGRTFTLDSP